MNSVADLYIKPGTITIIRFTGRAGAGKTTVAEILESICNQNGHRRGTVLGLDAFFQFSSKQRSAWINEPHIDDTEGCGDSAYQ